MSMVAPAKNARKKRKNDPANPLTARPDPLDRNVLAQQYGYALDLIYSNAELRDWFERGVRDQWIANEAKGKAELRKTRWFQENNEYARRAWAAESFGGADWQSQVDNAKIAVQNFASQMGADLTPEELQSLSKQYIYQGWYDPARQQLLMKALSEEIPTLPNNRGVRGQAGSFIDQLKAEAISNGLRYSEDWYTTAAREVASGAGVAEDYLREIREQAAGMFPLYADKIRQGFSMEKIASPYINLMAQTLELAPSQITLSDPYIREALMGIDEKGNPKPIGLWDFEKKLKNDPRWMKTQQASNDISSVATDILQIFGLRG